MASKIKVDQIEGSTASTVTLPSGQTLDLSSGTVTLPNTSVDLSTKVTGTLPVAKGGTGITSLGTAGQALKVNSGATALEFGNVSGGLLMTDTVSTTTSTSLNSVNHTDIAGLTFTKTPASTSSKFILLANVQVKMTDNSGIGLRIVRNIDGGSFGQIATHNNVTATYINSSDTGIDMRNMIALHDIDSPNTTSEVVYKVQVSADNNIILQNTSATSTFTIMEVSV